MLKKIPADYMVRYTFYGVFLLPAIAGIALGVSVYASASDVGYFAPDEYATRSDAAIRIEGLQKEYQVSGQIQIQIVVSDDSYDCGDLYITIYDSSSKSVVENGYFKECFVQNGPNMPTMETYSEALGESGRYSIEAKMYDRGHFNSITATGTIRVG